MTRLTDEKFWSDSYVETEFHDLAEHNVAVFVKRYLQEEKNKTAFELGSFPGAFLPTIGRYHYKLSGIDFNPRNSDELPMWLKSHGVDVGNFYSGDLFEFVHNNNHQFDLVCSFGLIEHFENFDELIGMHIRLLAPGGKLIITTPNFRGLMQYLPHKIFDSYNLSKHYLPSMSPKKWKKIIEDEGLTVMHAGYFGGYMFWVAHNQKRSAITRFFLRFTERFISQIRKILWFESSLFSAYCGIVAVKK
jgi:SAM-dependent methyltransferase